MIGLLCLLLASRSEARAKPDSIGDDRCFGEGMPLCTQRAVSLVSLAPRRGTCGQHLDVRMMPGLGWSPPRLGGLGDYGGHDRTDFARNSTIGSWVTQCWWLVNRWRRGPCDHIVLHGWQYAHRGCLPPGTWVDKSPPGVPADVDGLPNGPTKMQIDGTWLPTCGKLWTEPAWRTCGRRPCGDDGAWESLVVRGQLHPRLEPPPCDCWRAGAGWCGVYLNTGWQIIACREPSLRGRLLCHEAPCVAEGLVQPRRRGQCCTLLGACCQFDWELQLVAVLLLEVFGLGAMLALGVYLADAAVSYMRYGLSRRRNAAPTDHDDRRDALVLTRDRPGVGRAGTARRRARGRRPDVRKRPRLCGLWLMIMLLSHEAVSMAWTRAPVSAAEAGHEASGNYVRGARGACLRLIGAGPRRGRGGYIWAAPGGDCDTLVGAEGWLSPCGDGTSAAALGWSPSLPLRGKRVGEANHPGPAALGLDSADDPWLHSEGSANYMMIDHVAFVEPPSELALCFGTYGAATAAMEQHMDWPLDGALIPGAGHAAAEPLDWDVWHHPPAPHEAATPAPRAVAEHFISAAKFNGPVEGFVFKSGVRGLGYYRDGIAFLELDLQLRNPDKVAPVTLCLVDALGQLLEPPPTAAPQVGSGGRGAGGTGSRRGPRRPRSGPLDCRASGGDGGTAREDPTAETNDSGRAPDAQTIKPISDARTVSGGSCTGGHDASEEVRAADRWHATVGLWAVDTVNANAWAKALEYLRTSSADFALVQETRKRSNDDMAAAEAAARNAGWSLALAPAARTDAESTSGGTAAGARKHIGVALPTASVDEYPDIPVGRFDAKRVGAVCRGGVHIITLWLHDSVGIAAKKNLDLLQSVAAYIAALRGPWLIGADWNGTPSELAATGWLNLVGGAVAAPALPTCNGRVYDYFVVARSFSHAVHSVVRVSDADFGPHAPARLYLRARPRCIMVRRLKKPATFAAALPYGPEVDTDKYARVARGIASAGVAQTDLDDAYAKVMECIEGELASVAGLDAGEARKHAGRAKGPSFSWQPAMGHLRASEAPTTHVAMAWRRTSRWLRQALAAPDASTEREAAIRKIRHYQHPWNAAAADPEDVHHFTLLLAWRNAVDRPALRARAFAEALAASAEAQAQRLEARRRGRVRNAWTAWLHDGPGNGLRRQHRLSRTAVGWLPTVVKEAGPVILSEVDTLEDLEQVQVAAIHDDADLGRSPLSAQQVAENEGEQWAQHWAEGQDIEQPRWPADMGPLPPRMTVLLLRRALLTFAVGTALGWDALHPRALLRVSDEVLWALLRVLFIAECRGSWPLAVALVIIVLLPKADGGRRPVGLLPLLPRVWMRLRKEVIQMWERDNDREYLYAGPARGATVATWRQAARAELAAASNAHYAQALLDVVKAFEKIPHTVLRREAARLRYNLWILRLSLATYRLRRSIRCDGVFSRLLTPLRGITAGSGFATTEMRLVVIHTVDAVVLRYPMVRPSVFVDDISTEMASTKRLIVANLIPATAMICTGLEDDGLEVSADKSFCTASEIDLGRQLQEGLRRWGFRFMQRVKSLGAGLGAGVRRNMRVARGRLLAFRRRLPRFRALRRARVDTARLMRTGGTAALTYDEAIMGVAPSLLLQQRRAVAAAAAPAAGTAGQSIDMALLVEDELAGARADPAFPAHLEPIGRWALAVWEQWLPRGALMKIAAAARRRLVAAARPWAVVKGPAAAFVASATRLGWHVHSALSVTLDDGEQLRFDVDPPCVVMRRCADSVRRWRWRRVEVLHPSLHSVGRGLGASFGPLKKVLTSRRQTECDNSATRAALKSLLANRQWAQARCYAAGWVAHDRCVFCVHHALREAGLDSQAAEAVLRAVAATRDIAKAATRRQPSLAEVARSATEDHGALQHITEAALLDVLTNAPVGTLLHRAWDCLRHAPQRAAAMQAGDGDWARLERLRAQLPQVSLERALVPAAVRPSPMRMRDESFEWIVEPPGGTGTIHGRVYTDGSAVDNTDEVLRRLGWAFVVLDVHGNIVAAARGTVPRWVRDVPGAEAWALLQALIVAEAGGCWFYVDCKPCVDAMKRGVKWATAAQRPHARVNGMLHAAADDTPAERFVWLPSHLRSCDVGAVTRGDGVPVTAEDKRGNDAADRHAKAAAASVRVDATTRRAMAEHDEAVAALARWLAEATHRANHGLGFPARDTEADRPRRQARGAAPRAARAPPHQRSQVVEPRPPSLGGHVLQRDEAGGWRCVVCRHGGRRWPVVARQRCPGSAAKRWAERASTLADGDAVEGDGHARVISGDIVWCLRCGAYAKHVARGLMRPCQGRPPAGVGGGRGHQLRSLLAGKHPVTRERLPPPIPETEWAYRRPELLDMLPDVAGSPSPQGSIPASSRSGVSVVGTSRRADVGVGVAAMAAADGPRWGTAAERERPGAQQRGEGAQSRNMSAAAMRIEALRQRIRDRANAKTPTNVAAPAPEQGECDGDTAAPLGLDGVAGDLPMHTDDDLNPEEEAVPFAAAEHGLDEDAAMPLGRPVEAGGRCHEAHGPQTVTRKRELDSLEEAAYAPRRALRCLAEGDDRGRIRVAAAAESSSSSLCGAVCAMVAPHMDARQQRHGPLPGGVDAGAAGPTAPSEQDDATLAEVSEELGVGSFPGPSDGNRRELPRGTKRQASTGGDRKKKYLKLTTNLSGDHGPVLESGADVRVGHLRDSLLRRAADMGASEPKRMRLQEPAEASGLNVDGELRGLPAAATRACGGLGTVPGTDYTGDTHALDAVPRRRLAPGQQCHDALFTAGGTPLRRLSVKTKPPC